MKKLFALLLVAATLLAVLPLTGAATAAGTPTVSVGSAEGTPGSEVTIPVSLSDTPPIAGFRFKIRYDSDALELVNAEFPTLFSSPASGGKLTANPYIFSWFSTSSKDESKSGVIASLTFRIKADAKPGKSPLTISYDPQDVCDSALQSVPLATADGSIDILCPGHEWDFFGIECIHCGEQQMLSYYQSRPSQTDSGEAAKDFRFFVETSDVNFQKADYIYMTVTFLRSDGSTVRGPVDSEHVTTVYKSVIAGSDYYTPENSDYYLSGVRAEGIPTNAGVAYISVSVTFVKGETALTYEMGSAPYGN